MPSDAYPCLAQSGSTDRIPLLEFERPFLIGRDPNADVHVESPHCSRRQAVIVRHQVGAFVKPLSTTVPMELDGQPVLGLTNLTHGARLSFAEIELVYLEHAGIPSLPKSAASAPKADTPGAPPSVLTLEGAARVVDELMDSLRLPLTGSGVIGRDPTVRYTLDHARVSRRHAEITEREDGLWIRDLGSTNGTFVNGLSAKSARRVEIGDRVDVGPFSLVFQGDSFERTNRQGNLRIVARGLSRRVIDRGGGGEITILNDVSMIIPPRSFVALIGPSGSGKSTLMNALSAREPASDGQVLLNGLDFYKGFESLKQGIAMVHQDEAVHPTLSVADAVGFSARLRLPADTTDEDLADAVSRSLDQVDLGARRDVLIQDLSGGQRKRASLANETVHDPGLLFADEVTSGLDQETDGEIMRLLRQSAEAGRTVVCVTHNLANIEEHCTHVVVMAPPGFLAFYGTPAECVEFFGVQHLSQVYSALDQNDGPTWQRLYRQSTFFDQHVGDVSDPEREGKAMPENLRELGVAIRRRIPEVGRQFRILTSRANRLLMQDKQTLGIAAAQALTIALVLALVFIGLDLGSYVDGWLELSAQGQDGMLERGKHRSLLFMMGVSCLWFGTSNASKEIVKERTIYQQERDVNLSVTAYVFSKLPGLLALGWLQALTLGGLVFAIVGVPASPVQAIVMLITAILTGTGLGLLISSATHSQEQATTLVPIVLIPQIVMAGVIAPIDGIAETIGQIFVAGYWIVQGLVDQELRFAMDSGRIQLLYPDQGQWLRALLVLLAHFAFYLQVAILILTVRDSRGQSVYGARVRSIVSRSSRATAAQVRQTEAL